MIYTLTLNPAIDYYLHIGKLSCGSIIRSDKQEVCFGGKGINVSLILKELCVKSTALGFVAGFTGKAIEEAVKCDEIAADFVYVKDGLSRINVKIRNGEETDINAGGPVISKSDFEMLLKKLQALSTGDTLVLSGSVPSSMPKNTYEIILESIKTKDIRVVIDAEKELLLPTLKFAPFLIKPNQKELSDIFGVSIEGFDDAIKYAKELRLMGAKNVLVSMGETGAVLVDEKGTIHTHSAHSGKVVNTVGAGDSMVAGFIAGYIEMNDYKYALRLGSAAAGATTFSNSLASRSDIITLLENDSK